MNASLKTAYCALLFFGLIVAMPARTEQTHHSAAPHSEHLPYAFSNFVWWSDGELRGLLKNRIPGLGDEITPYSPMERRLYDTLTALLKQKGIAAEIQINEPSKFELTAQRAPGAPPVAIVFGILSPPILIDKVIVSGAPETVAAVLDERFKPNEGRNYSGRLDWSFRSDAQDELESKGYLDSQIEIAHDSPRRSGDSYKVNLLVTVMSGPQYRVGTVTADGGPLLKGKDLSSYFAESPGDIAGHGPFGRLAGQLNALYWHYGYADVEINDHPVFDRPNAKVSYHLEVVPGPIYHLQSLTIHNLTPEQAQRVRELLGMEVGDVFDGMAINTLYHKLPSDDLLKAYEFSFSPAKDRAAAQVDLTLDFEKTGGKASVTVQ
ncbi:MAG: hypothetical protein FWD64_03835 [Acidobacteriaceae bacterium]|nr:hypothetical protein [Acidobacteriaceae bacterium]